MLFITKFIAVYLFLGHLSLFSFGFHHFIKSLRSHDRINSKNNVNINNKLSSVSMKAVDGDTLNFQSEASLKTGDINIYNLSNESKALHSESKPKPKLLFLPGLDGLGDYSKKEILSLSERYEIRSLYIGPNDRSSFIEISDFIFSYIHKYSAEPIVLLGESFGGLLACHLATRLGDKISQLVLVNPATSYQQSIWPTTVPVILNSGPVFPIVGITALMATGLEPTQVRRIINGTINRIDSIDSAILETYNLIKAGILITTLLPPSTLEHRIQSWLESGVKLLEGQYYKITAPTLIMVGKNDRLLPSLKEGRRLRRMISSTMVDLIEFPNGGHALLDGGISLIKIFDESKVFRKGSIFDNIIPSEKDLKEIDVMLERYRKLVSPVFLSRDQHGYLKKGIQNVPVGKNGRPVLLVGNHQLFGLDLAFLIREFIKEKDCLMRGLAHPFIFLGNQTDMRDTFVKYGAVPVSPISYYELLKRNETILLFPGGSREACHLRGEEYKLFWPEKVDFVKMATLLDAIVVPFAAIGVVDSLNIVLDRNDMLNLPYFGKRLKEFENTVPNARTDIKDSILGPLALPKIPSRYYFLFQQPFDTRQILTKSKVEYRQAYENIRQEVQDGLNLLKEFREKDPYKNFVKRSTYEQLAKEQAPTTSLTIKQW